MCGGRSGGGVPTEPQGSPGGGGEVARRAQARRGRDLEGRGERMARTVPDAASLQAEAAPSCLSAFDAVGLGHVLFCCRESISR